MDVEVDDAVIDELVARGRNLLLPEAVMLVERAHRGGESGVRRERLGAYDEALAGSGGVATEHFDPAEFVAAVRDRLTDSETWTARRDVYRVGAGRVSRYPARWHEELGGVPDPREWVRFLRETDSAFLDGHGAAGAGGGVAEDELLDAIATVGQVPRPDVKARVEELRDAGEVAEDADQHPDAGVRLADEG